MTSPFGGSDETDGRGKPLPKRYRDVEPTQEVAMHYAREIARGWGKQAVRMTHLGTVDKKELPLITRLLIADLEKIDGGKR